MTGNLKAYWSETYRYMLPLSALFVAVLLLPPFSLFAPDALGVPESHLLLELFAVMVALLIAVVCWHDLARGGDVEAGLLLVGFTAVAAADLLHALVFEGMPPLLIPGSTERAIFFWFAGRTLVVLTLALLALRPAWRLPRAVWLGTGLAIGALLFWLGTFRLDWMPVTFVPGQGVTPFKRDYEYGLFLANLLLAAAFIRQVTPQNRRRCHAYASSCLVMALAEIAFSNFRAPSDFLFAVGHVYKIVAYGFLYRYAFLLRIDTPYRQARESEARFRALTELSADWYWEQDSQFRYTATSVQDHGGRAAQLIGRTRWEMPAHGVSAAQWQAHRRLLEAHLPFKNFVYQLEWRPNDVRWVSTSGAPFFGEHGEFLGYRGVGSDITDRLAAQQQVEFMGLHDALTGLPNRLLLQDRFEQARAHALRVGRKVGLLFIDLDHFKNVNDTLGHAAGDALLRQAAERLGESVSDADTVSRHGGDEFLILLPDLAQPDDILPVAGKIMERLEAPFLIEGQEVTSSASMGVALLPHDAEDFETLRKKAERAMYQAKEAGRNSYRFVGQAMNVETSEYLVLRNGLRRALERGEFTLHYQPQFDLHSGAVIGMEALLRWQHAELGAVSPARFIPVAEESGLIIRMSEWVLREACRQAVAWQRAGLPALVMGVNLSALLFKRGTVEQSVLGALQESGLAPHLLELELTESILIQDVDTVLACVRRLKQRGIQIAIDDFGTGYSSLAYLKRLDIDKLKIDQSFVRDLATDPDDAIIVRAIIQLGHGMNLRTIAEGVENEEMLRLLRGFGCDQGQGYHFARPMAAEEAARYLRARVAA